MEGTAAVCLPFLCESQLAETVRRYQMCIRDRYEPENLDIILQHMEQVGDVIREYHSCIYTLQGLFIGNWGEMNGTKYTDPDSMRELAARLADVSDASTFLSVRTPAQWRKITGEAAPDGWTENPRCV